MRRCGRRCWPSSSARSRRGPTCRSSSTRRKAARGRARPRAVRRPARPRQDDARADRRARARRQLPLDLRAGDRQGRAISRRCSPISKSATCSSSTRSTASTRRSRRSSIRRWRTTSSTSSSARARRRARSRSSCRRSRWSARPPAPGLLTTPLRDRFGIPIRLEFYTVDELELIVNRGARVLGIGMRRGRRQRDRPALARHAAHRRPPAAPGARFRRRRRSRRGHARGRRQRA